MTRDTRWARTLAATVVAVTVPLATLTFLTGGPTAALAAVPAADPSTLPAVISPSPSASTLPATESPTASPSAVPSTLPATVSPRPTASPSTLPATLSPEEIAKLNATTSGTKYTITFAARWCPSYESVRANRARNNIMESLQNLGPDTNYTSGQAVSPAKEDEPPQSACTPLTGWNFQLGDGIAGKTPGTNLSKVSDPGAVVTTTPSVPELSPAGNVTTGSVAGAVTLELSEDQVRAANSHKLWVQGGTATQPLGPIPGQYGFASLRCANDNLNGDNVEYISFTTNQRHVFCYTYLVKPPPKAGVIVIKKAVPDVTAPDITFNFGGNVSFNPGGAFSLRKGQSVEFVRGASADTGFDWVVTEDVPKDWSLRASCQSAKGTSETRAEGDNGVSITLAAGDTVTCTFTNSPNPPPNRLELGKYAKGGSGEFGFTVTGPDGATIDTRTLSVPREQLVRIGSYEMTKAGTYTVTETLPTSPKGTWALTAIVCKDATATARVVDATTATIDVVDPKAGGVGCALVNTFDSDAASLTIRSQTVGGAGGPSSYEITPESVVTASQEGARLQRADNTTADTFVTALPVTPADATDDLEPKRYAIQGFGPRATADGGWDLVSITCSGATIRGLNLATGHITVNLPPKGAVVCDYVWELDRPVTLDVTKDEVLAGGSRTSDVDIVVSCTNGAAGRLTVRPQDTLPASMTPTLRFVESTTCRVTETAPGGNPVDTAWRLTGPTSTTTGSGPVVDVRINHSDNPGAAYAVTFTNTYRSGTPTTPPTPPPTEPPSGGGGSSGGTEQVPVDPPALPEVIDPEEPNVVLPGEVETNAGRRARVSVVCTPLGRSGLFGRAPMGDVRLCEVTKDRDGRVTVRVLVRPVRVTVTLSAPAKGEYRDYRFTRSWIVR